MQIIFAILFPCLWDQAFGFILGADRRAFGEGLQMAFANGGGVVPACGEDIDESVRALGQGAPLCRSPWTEGIRPVISEARLGMQTGRAT